MADFDWGQLIGSLAQAGASVYASNKASDIAQEAAQEAAGQVSQSNTEALRYNAELTRPWREAGSIALGDLLRGTQPGGDLLRSFSMSDFQTDPGYQFRQAEGQKALDRAAAARGGFNSGAALKEAQRFGQDLASSEYQNAYNRWAQQQGNVYNRLAGISGTGQTSTQQLANTGANLIPQVGQAQAGATLAGANARQSAYQGAANAFGDYMSGSGGNDLSALMKRMFGG